MLYCLVVCGLKSNLHYYDLLWTCVCGTTCGFNLLQASICYGLLSAGMLMLRPRRLCGLKAKLFSLGFGFWPWPQPWLCDIWSRPHRKWPQALDNLQRTWH